MAREPVGTGRIQGFRRLQDSKVTLILAFSARNFGIFRLRFAVRTNNIPANDDLDINAPHREAAMFYGLFLRGHSAERLRRDIDVPRSLLEKWTRHNSYQEDMFQENVKRIVEYRKRVLQIFDELVSNRPAFPGIQ